MARRSIFSRITGAFSGQPGQGDQQPPQAQTADQADVIVLPADSISPAAPAAIDETLRKQWQEILDGLERQSRQMQTLVDRLATLPSAVEKLDSASRAQLLLAQKMQDGIDQTDERSEELSRTLHQEAESTDRQTQVLEMIRSGLAHAHEREMQVAVAVARLSEVLDELNRGNTAHVELMEQIRDRLTSANDAIYETLHKQQMKLTSRLTAIIILLAVLVVAVLVTSVILR